ncbi:MAG: mannose-6-phosphate isomerase, class I [Lentisphaeria bacterium]
MIFKPVRFWPLENRLCHYSWGSCSRAGHLPYLAELLSLPDDGRPLAELWIGAHPSRPSTVQINGQNILLDQLIHQFPEEILGRHCLAAGFQNLPFLLKILSCEKPLSIQCHPDLKTAAGLHAQFPERYPDSNHKPEILLALTPFDALAGFREKSDILHDLMARDLFHEWLHFRQEQQFSLDNKGLCQALFALPKSLLVPMLEQAAATLASCGTLLPAEKLFLRLLQDYPGDAGSLFAFLLNHLQLEPGQALFLAPRQIHAYLQGTGVECMASSDNVIRAGLTQKIIAPDELLAAADFESRPPEIQCGQFCAPGKRHYVVPAKEFQLTLLENANLDLAGLPETPGILLVLKGSGEICCPNGNCYFAGKGSAWLRPAKLRNGSFRPADENTLAVWCDGIVVKHDNIS